MNELIYKIDSQISKRNLWLLKGKCGGEGQITSLGIKSTHWNKNEMKSLIHVWLCATPWTVTHQAPLSMGFPRQEYWSGLPFPSPGDLPDPGIEPQSPTLQADPLTSEPPGKPWINGNNIHILLHVK